MSKLHEKAQAQVKQVVGQMIGDGRLVAEGREQQQRAEHPQQTEQGHDEPSRKHGGDAGGEAPGSRKRQAPE